MSKVTMFWVAIAVLIAGGVGGSWYMKALPGKYDALAQCLTDKGAKFYGAFWCPHCNTQKQWFGNSASKLPYVECSEADRKTQTAICVEKEIKQYPTWVFADESRLTGEQKPEALAEKTGCSLQ